jgi:hypothetical protein
MSLFACTNHDCRLVTEFLGVEAGAQDLVCTECGAPLESCDPDIDPCAAPTGAGAAELTFTLAARGG